MNEKNMGTQAPGITFNDALYAVFRHKWKILIISGIGILAAALLPFVVPRLYQSEAKLFVKYVVETKSPGQVGSASTVTSDEGANAINTEMEILTSLDLAQQVADMVGPEKVLAKAGGGTNRYTAAGLIHKNLVPEAAKGSKVIRVTFKHPDPNVVQVILSQVISAYLARHEEVHRHVGAFDDFLTQQTDSLKSRLKDTEEELRKAKASAGMSRHWGISDRECRNPGCPRRSDAERVRAAETRSRFDAPAWRHPDANWHQTGSASVR